MHLAFRPEVAGFMAVKRQFMLAAHGLQVSQEIARSLAIAFAQPGARLVDMAHRIGLPNVYGPAVLCYLEQAPAERPLPPGARQLTARDQPAVDHFVRTLGEPREYSADHPESTRWILGVYADQSLMGIAAVISWSDLIGEVFIDLLPQVRGRGWGTALAAAAARWTIDQAGLIAQYDTLWSNAASLAVARRLGFAPYAELFMAGTA